MSERGREERGLVLLRELRRRGEHSTDQEVGVEGLDQVLAVGPQDIKDLLDFLVQLGHIVPAAPQSPDQRYRLTPPGVRAAEQAAPASAFPAIPRIDFQQTVNGTANTQVGSYNTMHVQLHMPQGVSIDDMLKVVDALRQSVGSLPEDEQEEAESTLRRAEQAVKEGNVDKIKRYAGTFLDMGQKSLEFGVKAHEFAKLFGLL